MSYRRVSFEAELAIEGLPEGFAEDLDEDDSPLYDEIRQRVQDEVGHTGVVVTAVTYMDAST